MLTTLPAPTQTRPTPTQAVRALTPGEREWIRRQGRAARTLEARQRGALRRTAGSRSRRADPSDLESPVHAAGPDLLSGSLADERGREVVFVSHCL